MPNIPRVFCQVLFTLYRKAKKGVGGRRANTYSQYTVSINLFNPDKFNIDQRLLYVKGHHLLIF